MTRQPPGPPSPKPAATNFVTVTEPTTQSPIDHRPVRTHGGAGWFVGQKQRRLVRWTETEQGDLSVPATHSSSANPNGRDRHPPRRRGQPGHTHRHRSGRPRQQHQTRTLPKPLTLNYSHRQLVSPTELIAGLVGRRLFPTRRGRPTWVPSPGPCRRAHQGHRDAVRPDRRTDGAFSARPGPAEASRASARSSPRFHRPDRRGHHPAPGSGAVGVLGRRQPRPLEFFIGWLCRGRNSGATLTSALFGMVVGLGRDLAVDAYGEPSAVSRGVSTPGIGD